MSNHLLTSYRMPLILLHPKFVPSIILAARRQEKRSYLVCHAGCLLLSSIPEGQQFPSFIVSQKAQPSFLSHVQIIATSKPAINDQSSISPPKCSPRTLNQFHRQNSLATVQLLGRLHSPLKRRHDTICHIKALPQSSS